MIGFTLVVMRANVTNVETVHENGRIFLVEVLSEGSIHKPRRKEVSANEFEFMQAHYNYCDLLLLSYYQYYYYCKLLLLQIPNTNT